MVFRKASCRDIDDILNIIDEAKLQLGSWELTNGKTAIPIGKS